MIKIVVKKMRSLYHDALWNEKYCRLDTGSSSIESWSLHYLLSFWCHNSFVRYTQNNLQMFYHTREKSGRCNSKENADILKI
ncbi:MAG: hypothetical protein RLZZ535_2104 [Cyanobacteriota bacterium]